MNDRARHSHDKAEVEIRISGAEDRDRILQFIEESGVNPRHAVTWDALQMCAMTAWLGGDLIGAIPLELRVLQVAPGVTVPTVHETVVSVSPNFRAGGIGLRMQQAIFAMRPAEAVLVTVFRGDETSGAYRWYRKSGFEPVMHIESWFLEDPGYSADGSLIQVFELGDEGIDWSAMARLWHAAYVTTYGGFVDRQTRPLQKWLSVHPYRKRYEFKVLCSHDQGGTLQAYALVGIGTMHSETTRVDILEVVVERCVHAKHGQGMTLDRQI